MNPITSSMQKTHTHFKADDKTPLEKPLPHPEAKKIRFEHKAHGDTRVDHYHWMKNKEQLKPYLEEWNAYTEAHLEKIKPLSDKLYHEIMGRIEHTSKSVPYRIGKYFYYTRMVEGKNHPIYCRTLGKKGHEEIVFDENEEAKKHEYFDLINYMPSQDGRFVLLGFDTDGSQFGSIHIKDMSANQLLDFEIPNSNADMEWDSQSNGFYYVILDEAKRPFQLFYHKMGTTISQDQRIFSEFNHEYCLGLYQDKLHRYLFINICSKDSNELWCGPIDDVRKGLEMIKPRKDNFLYTLYPGEGEHFVAVTENKQNTKLMKIEGDDFSPENWKEFLPSRQHVEIEQISHFQDYLALVSRDDGLLKLRVYDKIEEVWQIIALPQEVGEVTLARNADYKTNKLRFHFESPVTPPTTYLYDMKHRTLELLKQKKTGDFDPSKYKAERIFAPAADGEQIPITIFYKKGLERDGQAPLHLYGYGAYSITYDPYFSLTSASLVERGVVCAIAHVRGGGYLGRQWYENGKLLSKKNTFTDFISSAEHLIKQGFTSSDKLMIRGGSAGGLLIGAVINMRPDLFQAAVINVPFVDAVTTMFDTTLPLTQEEWKEWGNPEDEKSYWAIKDYSPVDNIKSQDYPSLFVTSGINDEQVRVQEPAKWVAKLLDYKTDNNPVLFQINMGAGHHGASGRYRRISEETPRLAFLLSQVGIDD